eukprot:CAMPEP_0115847080 /NCGR_PEP_ID=MMETSP0287-20121206/10194_1 /TAXON_ID=412157 /ORGANISM="Chrysochromulina rotalis, Strain UIO044" /LENGTH=534 /DNA_ID=CAMNT_0003300895 /DNA_START=145 /DNA_END=1750 /DNA_ORIENTATION=-
MAVLPAITMFGVFTNWPGFDFFLLQLVYSTFGVFGTVLVHEIGHVAAGLMLDCSPKHIILWPLGGLAVLADFPSVYMHRIIIAFAGPATHVPMFFVWLGLYAWTGCGLGDEDAMRAAAGSDHACLIDPVRNKYFMTDDVPVWLAWLFYYMMYLNLAMFVFNCLIPIVPLDASTILVSALLSCDRPKRQIAQVALLLSCLCLTTLLVLWLVFAFASEWRNQSPLMLFMLGFLGWNVWGLFSAYKGDKLDKHPLFNGKESGAQPVVRTLEAAGGGAVGASTDYTASPSKGGSGSGGGGGWNPFRSKKAEAAQAGAGAGGTGAAVGPSCANPFCQAGYAQTSGAAGFGAPPTSNVNPFFSVPPGAQGALLGLLSLAPLLDAFTGSWCDMALELDLIESSGQYWGSRGTLGDLPPARQRHKVGQRIQALESDRAIGEMHDCEGRPCMMFDAQESKSEQDREGAHTAVLPTPASDRLPDKYERKSGSPKDTYAVEWAAHPVLTKWQCGKGRGVHSSTLVLRTERMAAVETKAVSHVLNW